MPLPAVHDNPTLTGQLAAHHCTGLPPLRQRPAVLGAVSAVAILTAAQATRIQASVLGMFDVPMVPEVQLAQQSLDHGQLRSDSQRSRVQYWPSGRRNRRRELVGQANGQPAARLLPRNRRRSSSDRRSQEAFKGLRPTQQKTPRTREGPRLAPAGSTIYEKAEPYQHIVRPPVPMAFIVLLVMLIAFLAGTLPCKAGLKPKPHRRPETRIAAPLRSSRTTRQTRQPTRKTDHECSSGNGVAFRIVSRGCYSSATGLACRACRLGYTPT